MSSTRALAVVFASSSLFFAAACSSAPDDSDAYESSEDGLSRRGVESDPPVKTQPPPKPPKPPVKPPVVKPGAGVLDPVSPGGITCTATRHDLRRKSRTCEALPGAVVIGGVTYVPGTSGRFRVERLLAGTTAPEALLEKACIYTWEPDQCSAPDTSKLLVEPDEDLVVRSDACSAGTNSCGVVTAPPTTKPPGVIPNGTGRCEVCGFAANRGMWVVLPAQWRGFQYQLAGEMQAKYVYLDVPPSTEATVVSVDLGYDVAAQDVSIIPAIE
jgi:hypothetical protein